MNIRRALTELLPEADPSGSILRLWPSYIATGDVEMIRMTMNSVSASEYGASYSEDLLTSSLAVEILSLIVRSYVQMTWSIEVPFVLRKQYSTFRSASDPQIPMSEQDDIHAIVCVSTTSLSAKRPALYLYDPRPATLACTSAAGPSSQIIRLEINAGFFLVMPGHIRWCTSPLGDDDTLKFTHCTYSIYDNLA